MALQKLLELAKQWRQLDLLLALWYSVCPQNIVDELRHRHDQLLCRLQRLLRFLNFILADPRATAFWLFFLFLREQRGLRTEFCKLRPQCLVLILEPQDQLDELVQRHLLQFYRVVASLLARGVLQ